MKLTTCDRSTHRVLSAAILLELKALGDKYGVDFSVDGGRFGDTTGMMRLEHKLQDMAGKQDPDKVLWDHYCGRYGLAPGDYGRTFISNRTLYRITGIAPNRPKFPIWAVRVIDNRQLKFGDSAVRAAMPKKIAA